MVTTLDKSYIKPQCRQLRVAVGVVRAALPLVVSSWLFCSSSTGETIPSPERELIVKRLNSILTALYGPRDNLAVDSADDALTIAATTAAEVLYGKKNGDTIETQFGLVRLVLNKMCVDLWGEGGCPN